MSAKHTPGPWSAEFAIWTGGPVIKEPGCFQITDSHENVLCTRHAWPERADEMHANARLIALAPDMFAELRRLAEAFGWEANHPAVRLIAKATGEQT